MTIANHQHAISIQGKTLRLPGASVVQGQRCFVKDINSGSGSGNNIIGLSIRRRTYLIPRHRFPTDTESHAPDGAGAIYFGSSYLHAATVRYATAAALPTYTVAGNVLTATANGRLNVDGDDQTTSFDLLVKDETGANAPYNWLYTVTAQGSAGTPWVLTRSSTDDTSAEVESRRALRVQLGAANAGKVFVLTTADPITLNTTNLTIEEHATTVANQTLEPGLYISKADVLIPAILMDTDEEDAEPENDVIGGPVAPRLRVTYAAPTWSGPEYTFPYTAAIFYDHETQAWLSVEESGVVFLGAFAGAAASVLQYSSGWLLLAPTGAADFLTGTFNGFTGSFTGSFDHATVPVTATVEVASG